MGHRPEYRPPYAGACIVYEAAQDPSLKHYIRGKLALAGIDLRVTAACWFDAVWAILMEAPHDVLTKTADKMTLAQNRARPDRDNWGLSAEEQALTQRAMSQTTPTTPTNAPMRGARRGDGRPAGW